MANIDANDKFVLSFRLLLYNPKAQRITFNASIASITRRNMASMELLFSGQLMTLTADKTHAQIEMEAASFLQRLTEPLLVVSLHGKTSLLRSLLRDVGDETAEYSNLHFLAGIKKSVSYFFGNDVLLDAAEACGSMSSA